MSVTPALDSNRKQIFGLNPNVFFLGLVSLLTDVSSEMIFTLLPLFLANVVGATTAVIGLVGGLSDGADAIFRIFSGWLSDRLGKRKALTLLGYGLSTLVKPLMLLALTWSSVLAVRFGDRVGKGIRSSPRDALVAASLSPRDRGRGFGLHRAMDTLGAVLGLGVAAAIIYHIQGGNLDLSLPTYRWLVIAGSIPAVLAVLVLLILVREKKSSPGGPARRQGPVLRVAPAPFSLRFKLFLGIMAVFTLGNSGSFFVILRAQDLGSSVFTVTLMLVLFNVVYALTSFPAGIISDRWGRRRMIVLGWAVYFLVYLGLAGASRLGQMWLIFAGYGVFFGLTEGVARAYVADLVAEDRRGTAYGLYYGVVGLLLVAAGVLAGGLWQAVSPAAAFYLSAGLALLASLGLIAFVKE